MSEKLAVVLMLYTYVMGFVTAWAFAHYHSSPFWRGFLDGFSLNLRKKK